jgi:hypothetical protein
LAVFCDRVVGAVEPQKRCIKLFAPQQISGRDQWMFGPVIADRDTHLSTIISLRAPHRSSPELHAFGDARS